MGIFLLLDSSYKNMISKPNFPYSTIQDPASERSKRAINMSKTVIAVNFRHFFFVLLVVGKNDRDLPLSSSSLLCSSTKIQQYLDSK